MKVSKHQWKVFVNELMVNQCNTGLGFIVINACLFYIPIYIFMYTKEPIDFFFK